MRYGITDEYGDQIVVAPKPPNGVYPRIVIRFTSADASVDMVLSDRTANELKRAITQSLRQSEVEG